MPALTAAPLTPALTEEVRRCVEHRDSALEDLRLCPAPRQQSRWAQDRRDEVAFANRVLANTAERLGMEPAALIAACCRVDEG